MNQSTRAASRPANWQLELTLLGIGGAFDADRGVANTGALLQVREGEQVRYRYLIDCGHTCGRQLDHLGLTYDDIDGVLLTHTHGDHMDGLELYGYRGRFKCQRTAVLYASAEVIRSAWTSLGAKMAWLKVSETESRAAAIDDFFDATAIGKDGLKLADGRLHVRAFPVPHIPRDPACGLRIELEPEHGNGPVIRWSGDTTFLQDSPLFEDFDAERGDLIFHECCFEPYYATTVHTHVDELQKLPEALRESIVLIHHGRVEESPERVSSMVLGQPFQNFLFQPDTSRPARPRASLSDRMRRSFADAGS